MLLKKNLGFSIWIYVFGFSWCNGLIKNLVFFLTFKNSKKSLSSGYQIDPSQILNPIKTRFGMSFFFSLSVQQKNMNWRIFWIKPMKHWQTKKIWSRHHPKRGKWYWGLAWDFFWQLALSVLFTWFYQRSIQLEWVSTYSE